MRPHGTAQALEARRHQAIRLRRYGYTRGEVARAVGASPSSVWRWEQASQTQGLRGLRPRPTPGRPPTRSSALLARLDASLSRQRFMTATLAALFGYVKVEDVGALRSIAGRRNLAALLGYVKAEDALSMILLQDGTRDLMRPTGRSGR